MINKNDVQKALNVDVAINSKMATALQKWANMYINDSEWLSAEIKSLNLAAAIASSLAGNVTVEMGFAVTGSARAEFLDQQMKTVITNMQQTLELGLAKGGMVLKPYVSGKKISVDYVQADQFYPVSFDSDRNMQACVFSDVKKIGSHYYTRLELHSLNGNVYTVRNAAFKSNTKDDLGMQVGLETVADWADLSEEASISPIEKPLFGYYKVPLANNIDPDSPLGVSCYSRAVELIEQADKQWSNFLFEFESGKRALYVDESAFDADENGKPLLPKERIYRTIKATGAVDDDTLFQEWSPKLRDKEQLNGLDAILKRIENACGLAFGTLVTDPASVQRTAQEIKASQQKTYLTITNNQKALQAALDDLLYAMDVWTTIYKLAPAGKYETTYSFDDSVVTDRDSQFMQDLQSLGNKTISRVEFRMRNYGETQAQAEKAIALIDKESKQSIDLFSGFGDDSE